MKRLLIMMTALILGIGAVSCEESNVSTENTKLDLERSITLEEIKKAQEEQTNPGKPISIDHLRKTGVDINVPYHGEVINFTDIDQLKDFITSPDYLQWVHYVEHEQPRQERSCWNDDNAVGGEVCVDCQCLFGCLFAGCVYNDGRSWTYHWLDDIGD